MNKFRYSHERLVSLAKFTTDDLKEINQRRRRHNRLGFAYQLAFARLLNRFPAQRPFEIIDEVLTYVSVQLDIPAQIIQAYTQRQQTISEHQDYIRAYLKLRRFGLFEIAALTQFCLRKRVAWNRQVPYWSKPNNS